MSQPTWTIQGQGIRAIYSVLSFATKREAVKAMMGMRKNKTPIVKDGHHYRFTANEG